MNHCTEWNHWVIQQAAKSLSDCWREFEIHERDFIKDLSCLIEQKDLKSKIFHTDWDTESHWHLVIEETSSASIEQSKS